MTEQMTLTLEQSRQLNRSLTEKVLDKAASDPQWKQQLIDDPEAAMQEANFPETRQLEQTRSSLEASQDDEVRGQALPGGGAGGGVGGDVAGIEWQPRCQWYCLSWTIWWEQICSGPEV